MPGIVPRPPRISRRAFVLGGAASATAGVLGALPGSSTAGATAGSSSTRTAKGRSSDRTPPAEPTARQKEALRVLGRTTLRAPGSRPDPSKPAGTDTLPGIEAVVVLMMENHSFDNLLGMLGRGDGFTLDRDGQPTATNPYADGSRQRAFRMPTTCQLPNQPSQEWRTSHLAYNGGRLDGFVSSPIGPTNATEVGGVAMGYWTGDDLPYTYALARTFPLADRYFSSVLGQTDANRRYLIAGTSSGMTDEIDTPADVNGTVGVPSVAGPANGTIFEQLSQHGITWADYTNDFPTGATPELYPIPDTGITAANKRPTAQFLTDAAGGTLPQFSLVEPDYSTQSQENPQNIAVGEAFLAGIVNALGASPQWKRSLLVLTYDEHGGYYDHVPPPVALAPDDIPPHVYPGEEAYDGFERYGFRVPGLVVSPFAKRHHVSHQVYDHTSVLALVERKWNLAALTYRDANANDLTDLIDLDALASRRPTFPTFPVLPAPGNTPEALACSVTGPGTIPPAGSILP
jgi:phospholipase C